MKTDKKYLNFPISMLAGLYTNKRDTLNNIFLVGFYLYSETLNGTEMRRFRDTLQFFNRTYQDIRSALNTAKEILSTIPDNSPTTGIEIDMLMDYYDNYKSEFNLACLSAFLAIKSILGKKTYVKTNKAFIHARMFGESKSIEKPIHLTPLEKKYTLRYHMDKVLLELQLNWYLKTLWNHNRGFYLSFELSHEDLAKIIEKDKYIYKKNVLRREKRKAIKTQNAMK